MSRQRSAVVLASPRVRAPLAGILAYLQAGGRCHHARSSADDLAGTTPTSSTASSPTTIGAGGLAWQVRWLSAADTLQVADRLRDLDVPAAGDVGADPAQTCETTTEQRAWAGAPASGRRGGPCRSTTSSGTTPRRNQGRPVRVRSSRNNGIRSCRIPGTGFPKEAL